MDELFLNNFSNVLGTNRLFFHVEHAGPLSFFLTLSSPLLSSKQQKKLLWPRWWWSGFCWTKKIFLIALRIGKRREVKSLWAELQPTQLFMPEREGMRIWPLRSHASQISSNRSPRGVATLQHKQLKSLAGQGNHRGSPPCPAPHPAWVPGGLIQAFRGGWKTFLFLTSQDPTGAGEGWWNTHGVAVSGWVCSTYLPSTCWVAL